jgi:hypothetical protein
MTLRTSDNEFAPRPSAGTVSEAAAQESPDRVEALYCYSYLIVPRFAFELMWQNLDGSSSEVSCEGSKTISWVERLHISIRHWASRPTYRNSARICVQLSRVSIVKPEPSS